MLYSKSQFDRMSTPLKAKMLYLILGGQDAICNVAFTVVQISAHVA